jgi:hypothetical protein
VNNNEMNVVDEVWKDKYLKKYKLFEHFVLSELETAINENAQHFIPQFLFVTNSAGLIIVDHIGKLETLNETLAFLKSHDIDISPEHKSLSNVDPIDVDNIYTPEMKTKDNNFNLIRLISAFLVLFSHSFIATTDEPNTISLRLLLDTSWGGITVDVFYYSWFFNYR